MFRIMIVDDEYTIRKGLINFIDWYSLDCEVICEADNGILAKKLLHLKCPDIVICDIKMPGLDGIKFTQYVYENTPSIKVILLTGYSDFEYAQAAVKFNVVDFVLKPSSTEKIIDAVNKSKKLILVEQAKINKLQSLENEVKEIQQQMQEKFIQDLLNGIFFNEGFILDRLEQLKININNFYILVFEIHSIKIIESSLNLESKGSFLMEIKNFITTIFKNYHSYELILNNNSLCTLVSFNSDNQFKNMEDIIDKSEEIVNFVNNFIKISITIGISGMHTNPCELRIAFDEAKKSLINKFYDDGNIFIYSKNIISNHSREETVTNNYIDKIIKCVEFGNASEAVKELYGLIEYQKKSKKSIEHIKTTGILICSLCSKLINTYSMNSSDTISSNSESIYELIMNCQSISKLSSIIEKIIQSTVLSLSSLSTESNYIIKKVVNYIKENYMHSIKLDTLAGFVHVNSCYLSRLFKKETGATITETITKIRIKKAKELLAFKNYKTYEIASMVGFEDPAYFSYVFKKHTGLSPNSYRRQNI